MIVKVEMESKKPIVLPRSYNHTMQRFFYSYLAPDISAWLHDQGMKHYDDKLGYYKFFTFSKIIGLVLKKEKITFAKNIRIYYAFSFPEIANTFITNPNFQFKKYLKNTL